VRVLSVLRSLLQAIVPLLDTDPHLLESAAVSTVGEPHPALPPVTFYLLYTCCSRAGSTSKMMPSCRWLGGS
jgi:hypothetical protein